MLDEQFGNYKFLSILGEGGMATVYLAENTMLDSLVAIKVLKEEFVHNKNIRKRFLDEAKKMVRVKHPNIIQVMDLIDAGDIVAIVMEYVDGYSLKEVIEKSGKLSNDEINRLFPQILLALKHVHDAGFVHRDIKPSNFMLSKDGTIKLSDFGIAKDKNVVAYTETGSQMGTPLYMSPEQIKSTKDVDHRSDIYSLGMVLYEMITSSFPFDKVNLTLPEIQVCILKSKLPITRTLWDPQLQKATEKNENNRFQSCDEWLQALKLDITPKPPILTTPKQKDKTKVKKINVNASSPDNSTSNIISEQSIKEKENKPPFNDETKKTRNQSLMILIIVGGLICSILVFLIFLIFESGEKNSPKTIDISTIRDSVELSKIVKFQSVQLRNETKYPYLISFAWVNKKERICKGWYKVGVNEVLKFTLPKNFISNEIYFFGITNDENYKTSGSDNFFYVPKNIRKKNFTVINGEIKNGKGAIVRQGFKKIILSDSITKYRLLD